MMDELMKSYMNIMADRDSAIRERNMALVEKKKALIDRDIAIMQRDAVVAERDNVILERDNIFAQLHYQSNSMNSNGLSHKEKHIHFIPHLAEAAYNPREVPFSDTYSNSEATSETATSKKVNKRKTKQAKTVSVKKSPSKPLRKGKKIPKNSSSISWNNDKHDLGDGCSWKDDLGLNQSSFDERAVPVPVCSCTGKLQPCYKWGKGGWQSACCTTTISMYPLPQTGNKRHTRIGGRKMSGNVYTKLLSRLASEGHDLSSPVDLKEHWCRHGTNRYITIK